jgi:hypothetical protein
MLKKILRNFFKNIIYPTKQRNWYQSKGYIGIDEAAQFEHFISAQKDRNAIFYNEFKDLELKRQFITSGHNHLDSVLISMPAEAAKDKPGFGLCFIFFQGRAEYYESRFRDMARQCKATGASAFGFNPKGFNSSNGSTERIKDIVDDGIAVVNYLLSQGKSLNQIILQGNSLGAAVQEMVSKHFKATKGTALRQINSNSFKNLGAVFAHQYHIPFLEKLISKIMRYGEWEIEVDDDFYTTGPHRCYFRREGDRTILPQAEYHSMINHERDYENCPDHFKDTNRWLNTHTQLIYRNITDEEDPHDLSLHHFMAKPLSTMEPEYTIYDLINRFISN